jgi:hypothetical protein
MFYVVVEIVDGKFVDAMILLEGMRIFVGIVGKV